jgi:hypothetical protein
LKITVIAVNQDEAALVRGTSALGWRGKFGCPLVVGEAVFLPCTGRERDLHIGNTIVVEAGYEDISDFVIGSSNALSIQPLDNPGDYLVNAEVLRVAPEGMVQVAVREFELAVERKHLNGTQPCVGNHVTFKLYGLSLWDSGQRM